MDIDSDPVWKVHSEMTDCSLPWQLGNNASIINTAYQNYFPLAGNRQRRLSRTASHPLN